MSQDELEPQKVSPESKRIFINHVDSFQGINLAKVMFWFIGILGCRLVRIVYNWTSELIFKCCAQTYTATVLFYHKLHLHAIL